MNLNNYLLLILIVGLGGFIGAVLRFVISGMMNSEKFPFGTLFVNILGSFLLGGLIFYNLQAEKLSSQTVTFLGIGILGAFTTMSTFSLETVNLLEQKESVKAGMNILLNLGGCIGAVGISKVLIGAIGKF